MLFNLTRLTGVINNEAFDITLTTLPNVINISPNIYLKFSFSGNLTTLSLLNTGSEPCNIENINLKIVSIKKEDYDRVMIYSENIKAPITLYSLKEKIPPSYLFSMFLKKKGVNSLIGFLGSKLSKTSLICSPNKDNIDITASWYLCNHILNPDDEFTLDPFYFSLDSNYVNLLQTYILTLKNHFNIEKVDTLNIEKTLRRAKPQLLFSRSPNESCLFHNNTPISVNINDETYYPLDITKTNALFDIMLSIQKHCFLSKTIELNNVLIYLNIINEYKLFNGYYKLNRLLSLIKVRFKDMNILVDDCPLGLLLNNNGSIIWRIHSEPSFILKKPKYSFDLDFIVKVNLFQLLDCKSIKYYIRNHKIKTVLESITNSYKPYIASDEPCFDIIKNFNLDSMYIPYIYKHNIFSFFIRNDDNVLIAIFNLSHRSSSFNIDFSSILKDHNLDGDLVDVFSKDSIKINKGQLSLKKIKPMDCCVFKKALWI